MLQAPQIAGINKKISRWKRAFADAIHDRSGRYIQSPNTESFAQIICGYQDLTMRETLRVAIHCAEKIGNFTQKEFDFLSTPGYVFAKQVAEDIFENYGRQPGEFEKQATDGPIIATPYEGENAPPLAVFFHAVNGIEMLEILYHAPEQPQVQVQDTLYIHPYYIGHPVSIKAVEDIRANPRVKQRMDDLGVEL